MAFSFVAVLLLRSLAEGLAAGDGDNNGGSSFNPLRPCFGLLGFGSGGLQVRERRCVQWENAQLQLNLLLFFFRPRF